MKLTNLYNQISDVNKTLAVLGEKLISVPYIYPNSSLNDSELLECQEKVEQAKKLIKERIKLEQKPLFYC